MWRCLTKTICEGAERHPPQQRPRWERRQLMFGDGGGQLKEMDFGDLGSGEYGAHPGRRAAEESHACPDRCELMGF